MDFLELAKQRYSCRMFSNKEVEKEKIDLILEAARVAPTGRNFQPQRILVLTEKEELEKLSACTQYGWGAPVIMVICYDKNVSWKRKQDGAEGGEVDASIVTTHMMLEAQNLGLGTTWVGSFAPDKLKEVYEFPENLEPVAILPIGYPADDAHPSDLHSQRNDIEQIVYWNKIK